VPAFVAVVLVFCPLLGLLLNVAVFRPLARATDEAKIMATVGLLIALPALARFIIEVGITTLRLGHPRREAGDVAAGDLALPAVGVEVCRSTSLDSNRIVVLVDRGDRGGGLWALMRHTPSGCRCGRWSTGRTWRRCAGWTSVGPPRGVGDRHDVRRSRRRRGGARHQQPQEASFNLVMFVAAAAAVLGGMRSIPLAFAGGLLIGVLESLVRRYATFASDINGFNNAVPFVLLLVGLVLLARDRGRRGGSVVAQPPPVDWTDDSRCGAVACPGSSRSPSSSCGPSCSSSTASTGSGTSPPASRTGWSSCRS
jgi:branched-subunit amino acid ABC-type transport system permease component